MVLSMKKRLLIVCFALVLMMSALPLSVFAQEATEAPSSETATTTEAAAEAESTDAEAPQGVSTLVLLMGIGALLLVGGAVITRSNSTVEPTHQGPY